MSENTTSQEDINDINQKLLKAYQREEEFWKQRSRQLWLALGDKNTGYFHAATKGRRAINSIVVIESDRGTPVFEEQEIVKAITNYYKHMFTSEEGERTSVAFEALKPCVSQSMNETLISMPSDVEVKRACFSIHPDKAPGPDGFSASFFKVIGRQWEPLSLLRYKRSLFLEICHNK